MFRILICALAALTLLTACSYPVSRIETGGKPPSLAIEGLERGSPAVLTVDGVSYGMAAQYDGRNRVLTLEPGAHHIVITQGGEVLLSERIVAAGGAISTVRVR